MSRILDNLQPIHFIHVREVIKVTMSKKAYVRIFKNTDNVMNAMIVMVLKVVIKGMKIMIIVNKMKISISMIFQCILIVLFFPPLIL